MRICVAIPCRANSHHKASERSKHVEGTGELRVAAKTIRAVNFTQVSQLASFAALREFVTKFWRKFCVERKPRNRKLIEISGSSAAARKKIVFAGRGSELNRRRRAHIGGLRCDQAILDQVIEKLAKIRAQSLGINIKLFRKLIISRFNRRRGSHQLPHASTDRVQTEISFGIQIEQHRFLIEEADQNIFRDCCTVS